MQVSDQPIGRESEESNQADHQEKNNKGGF